MAEDTGNQDAAGASKKSILSIRIKERQPVTTSQGTFYVRHLSIGDMKTFSGNIDESKDKASHDLRALGELTIKTLVCNDNDSEKPSGLTEETFSQLSSTDIERLIDGVIEVSDLTPLPENKTLEGLGSIVFDEVTSDIKRSKEMTEKLKSSMGSAFGSLSQGAMKSLVDSMSSLNAVRDSLKLSQAVEAFRKAQEAQERLLGGMTNKEFLAHAKIMEMSQPRIPELYRPKIEETPMGRAAIASEDSAAQLREVAGSVGVMAVKLAELHTVFLTKIIPEWKSSLEDNSKAMNKSFHNAEQNLKWAKWALMASVVVTIAMTVWQIWVARDYKLDNDQQQANALLIMKEQLKASQELNSQLKTDAMQMKEELVKLQQSVEKLNASQPANLKAVQAAK